LDLGDPTGGLLDRFAERYGLSPTGHWVAENAHRFGFIVRYGLGKRPITGYIYEPWHITYVGLDIAFYMHTNSIPTLEEFVGRNPWVTLPPPAIR
jgi:D-alanyl-D-alanine carboxypeptidase